MNWARGFGTVREASFVVVRRDHYIMMLTSGLAISVMDDEYCAVFCIATSERAVYKQVQSL